MKTIGDYANSFDAIAEFEKALCEFTGAPYCITTDCCTHAIEIAFRLRHTGSEVSFPAKTYLSVLMTMHKLGVKYTLEDSHWRNYYVFKNTAIWDCARYLQSNMYQAGTIQCLSFGRTKPLQIGRGGCILTDDHDLYQRASRMRYDGRDIFTHSPWVKQEMFEVGYHYYLRPEECVQGLNLLDSRSFVTQLESFYDYPDCRQIQINA